MRAKQELPLCRVAGCALVRNGEHMIASPRFGEAIRTAIEASAVDLLSIMVTQESFVCENARRCQAHYSGLALDGKEWVSVLVSCYALARPDAEAQK